MTAATISVLVAEDEVTTRSAIVALLGLTDDIEVVAEAGDGVEAVDRARALRPAVLLTDLEMPHRDGLETSELLADEDVRIVLLTRHTRPGALRRAIDLGVDAVLTKETPVDRVAEVIRLVHRGESFYDPKLTRLADAAEESPLTTREVEVLRVAATGAPIEDISAELHLAKGTVRNYLSRVMSQLGARTRHEAVRRAERSGWI